MSWNLQFSDVPGDSLTSFIYYLFQDNFKNAKIIKNQEVPHKIHAKQLLYYI